MGTGVQRTYRGVGTAERRASRRTLLVQACLDEVGERGVAAVTAESVSARAGLTKRYFYESFADRSTLLVAVLDELLAQVREAIGAALAGLGPENDVTTRTRATVQALVVTLDGDARRARLFAEASAHETLQHRREDSMDDFARLLVVDVFGVASPGAGDHVAARLVVAGTTDVVARWLAGEVALERDALVEEITRIGVGVAGRAPG